MTVVFPLMPVTPSSLSRSTDGWPWKAWARTDVAAAGSGTTTTGTRHPGTGAAATTAIAPRATACSAKAAPSARVPPRATNT